MSNAARILGQPVEQEKSEVGQFDSKQFIMFTPI